MIPGIFDQIMENAGSKFRKKVDNIILFILTHDLE